VSVIRIGTRGSALALRQTELVANRLRDLHPDHEFAVERIATKGDVLTDVPLSSLSGQGVFVDAIEAALREERIDLAVHSAKDLPSRLDPVFTLGAVLERADARDVCVSRGGPLAGLARGARVGTSSRRRACQLRARRSDLDLVEMRGNVDTRLRRLDEGRYDAIVLAAAGLQRLGLADRITEYFDVLEILPCPGQGAIAVEVRTADARVRALVALLGDPATAAAVEAERSLLARLGAGCTAPVGAYARSTTPGMLAIDGFVGALDGRMVRAALTGSADQAAALGNELASRLIAQGAADLLAEAGRTHVSVHA
jgi:hydroxymethylbilane synthase